VKLSQLALRDEAGHYRAVIETPRGSKLKIKYEPAIEAFVLSRPLLLGLSYPYDWGFFPSTVAPDGDPLDVMLIHDAPTYPGIVVACEPVGVVKVTQRGKSGARERNDRVIAVPANAPRSGSKHRFSARFRQELEAFFMNAVLMENKKLDIQGWAGPSQVRNLLRESASAYEKRQR
jgi:inorganic pyrophosphatase